MISFIDALVIGRVIGEVVDLFVPTVNMAVSYGSKKVNNGCDVKPSMAAERPSIQISDLFNEFYTLGCGGYPGGNRCLARFDFIPRCSCPRIELQRCNRLELVTNFLTPAPALEIHRHVFVLYRQKCLFPLVAPWSSRASFNTRPAVCAPVRPGVAGGSSILQLSEGATAQEEAYMKNHRPQTARWINKACVCAESPG